MNIEVTGIFEKNFDAKTRFVFNQGGTRSSKTFSLMQLAYYIASTQNNVIISVTSETMPHLRRGAMRDFFSMLQQSGLYSEKYHNKTDNSYKVNNSLIEFFSCDTVEKVHGPSRDYLFCNEIQNIKYEVFFHLASRTSRQVFSDYNPTHEFWIYPEFLNNKQYDSDITYIHSTILDNPFISDAIKKDVLLRAERDANYKRVYLDGLPGTLEGLVFNNFKIIDALPNCRQKYYGIDWGFTNDPTTLIEVYFDGDNIYLNELIYQTGLTNSDIIQKLKALNVDRNQLIIADNAEPKSVEDLFRAGFNIKPCNPKKEVKYGLDLMQQKNIFINKNSLNIINEFRNYRWSTDKNGKALNEPVKMFDHAIDPTRYVVIYHANLTNKPVTGLRTKIGAAYNV